MAHLRKAQGQARRPRLVEPAKEGHSRQRCELLSIVAVSTHTQGFIPEIIPSTFAENLPKSMFEGRLSDYPIATAGEKVSCSDRIELIPGHGGVRASHEGER